MTTEAQDIISDDVDTTHQITFTSADLAIEQQIVISPVMTTVNIDNVIEGLNSGEYSSTLDHDMENDEGSWIRDSQGNGIAVIVNQKVTVTGESFKDYNKVSE